MARKGAVEQDAFTPDAMDSYLNSELLLYPMGTIWYGARCQTRKGRMEIPLGFITESHCLILESSQFQTDRLLNSRRISSTREPLFTGRLGDCQYMILKRSATTRRTVERFRLQMDSLISVSNKVMQKKTTIGWQLLVRWKDGSKDWVAL
jgi:hypothetical protein